MFWWLTALAFAGYGDPVDGVPSASERAMHLFTNAVRTDPAGFDGAYSCSFSGFAPGEQTPKPPLLWHVGLGAAAVFHSDDMAANNHFSHTSSDGTSFAERVSAYYPSWTVGENIGWNYSNDYTVVVQGWMCSSGHRANIMSSTFKEIGTGRNAAYYTQVFGGGTGATLADHPLTVGAHWPLNPAGEPDFLLVLEDPGTPLSVQVVVDGVPHDMTHVWGTPGRGTWALQLPVADCTPYWFRAQLSDGSTHAYPEDGSFGFGSCAYDDTRAGWFADQPLEGTDAPGDDDDDDDDGGSGGNGDGAGDGGGGGNGGDGNGGDDTEADLHADPSYADAQACGCGHGGSASWLGLLALLFIRRRSR